MLPTSFKCLRCSSLVKVPAHFTHDVIGCPACGMMFEPPPASRQSPSQDTALQYPGHYTPPEFAPTLPGRGFPYWAVALILCVMFVIGGFVALTVWATDRVNDAREQHWDAHMQKEQAAGVPPAADWVAHRDPDGYFTAMFPGEPSVSVHTLEWGQDVTTTAYISGAHRWDIVWTSRDPIEKHNFAYALEKFAIEHKGSVTKTVHESIRGMDGIYGEIDRGRIKVQMFATADRVWTLSAGSEFEFFVANVLLSEKALTASPLPAQPLHVQFKPWTVYEYEKVGGYEFVATGGTLPYTWELSGELPAGVTEKVGPTLSPDSQIWQFVGVAGAPGDYALTLVVTDADGKSARAEGVLSVRALPDRVGALVGVTKVYDRMSDPPVEGGPVATVPVGLAISGTLNFEQADKKYPATLVSVEHSGLPSWMKFDPDNQRPGFGGKPPESGEFKFTIRARARVSHSTRDYPLSIEFIINVTPLPPDCLSSDFAVIEAPDIDAQVAMRVDVAFKFTAARPTDWHERRSWSIAVSWLPDIETLSAEMPKGLTVKPWEGFSSDYPGLLIQGIAEEPCELQLVLTVSAKVLYVDEPYDFLLRVNVRIAPLADDQIPAEMPPPRDDVWEVRGAAGRAIHHVLTHDNLRRPSTWTNSMHWSVTGEWLVDEASAPEGLIVSEYRPGGWNFPTLILKGSVAEPGEWEFEVKAKVRIRYIDQEYEVIQKVKLVIK